MKRGSNLKKQSTAFLFELKRRFHESRIRYRNSGLGHGRVKPTVSELLFFVGATGLILFGTKIAILQQQDVPPVIPTASVTTTIESPFLPGTVAQATNFYEESEPTRIVIPAIGVDAVVDPVGKNSDGSMETPDYLSGIVGWYKYSPTPGEIGPSVMVGHVGNKQGKSVFWDLGKLAIGNEIYTFREDGTKVLFTVTSVGQYGKDEFPTNAVYSDIDHAGLRLITCGGKFDYLSGKYPDNTVVFARMQSIPE